MINAMLRDQQTDTTRLLAMVEAMKTTPRHTWVIGDLVALSREIDARQGHIVEAVDERQRELIAEFGEV